MQVCPSFIYSITIVCKLTIDIEVKYIATCMHVASRFKVIFVSSHVMSSYGICVCVCVCVRARVSICTHACVCVWARACVCLCACTHVPVHVVLPQTERVENQDHDHSITSKINLVDLAGSERQSQAQTTGERLRVGVHALIFCLVQLRVGVHALAFCLV